MILVNFLSPEYRQKIFIKKLSQTTMVVILIFSMVLLGINFVLKNIVSTKEAQKTQIMNDIEAINVEIKRLEDENAKIPNLANKIKVLDDILNQKKYGFSEVLFRLVQNVPSGIWLDSLNYDGKTMVLKGFANKSRGLSAERNMLSFEQNLRETASYIDVAPEYAKVVEKDGNEIKEFKITIILADQ